MGGTAIAAGPPFLEFGTPAGGDLAGAYPNPTIGANAVESAEVVDASLRSDDIAIFKGQVNADLGPIPGHSCTGGFGRSIGGLQRSDYVLFVPAEVTPSNFIFPTDLFVQGRIEGTDGDLAVAGYVCNFSSSEIDPYLTTFRYLVIR